MVPTVSAHWAVRAWYCVRCVLRSSQTLLNVSSRLVPFVVVDVFNNFDKWLKCTKDSNKGWLWVHPFTNKYSTYTSAHTSLCRSSITTGDRRLITWCFLAVVPVTGKKRINSEHVCVVLRVLSSLNKILVRSSETVTISSKLTLSHWCMLKALSRTPRPQRSANKRMAYHALPMTRTEPSPSKVKRIAHNSSRMLDTHSPHKRIVSKSSTNPSGTITRPVATSVCM